MSLSQRVISEKTASLEFIKGHMVEGGIPFFAYVVLREADANIMRKQKVGLSIPPNSIILYSDYGHEVSKEVEDYVMTEFHKLLKN